MSCFVSAVFGQDTINALMNMPETTDGIFEHITCATAKQACKTMLPDGGYGPTYIIAYSDDADVCNASQTVQYFSIYMSSGGSIYLTNNAHTGNYILYGPFVLGGEYPCQLINNGQANQASGNLGVNSTTINASSEGFYILQINTSYITMGDGCGINLGVYSREASCDYDIGCDDCISSFSPTPGKYLISAWVKGDENNINEGYTHPNIKIYFDGSSTDFTFIPSGNVIDGWQQIKGVITIPTEATGIYIQPICQTGSCFFDDIRFLPTDASMKTYVYNPRTRKMMATLDDRNYATYYEYDEEGKLIRVKKETERGVMTIKENRNHIQKNQ